MQRLLYRLFKLFEYFLVREYIENSFKNFVRSFKFIIIHEILIVIVSIIFALFSKTLLPTIILLVVRFFFLSFTSFIMISHAKKDQEEYEIKSRDFPLLYKSLINDVRSSFAHRFSIAIILSLSVSILPIIVSLSKVIKSPVFFITSILLFVSLAFVLYITSLFIPFFHNNKKNNKISFSFILIRNKIIHFWNYQTKFKTNFSEIHIFYSKHITIIYALLIGFTSGVILSIIFKLSFYFVLFLTASFFCVFSWDIFKHINKYGRESKRPFIFARSIMTILLLPLSISFIRLTPLLKEESFFYAFKDFILPLFAISDSIAVFYHNILFSKSPLIILIPIILFTILYFAAYGSHWLIHQFENYSDKKITEELLCGKHALLFGDNLSLYPFTIQLVLSFLILSILYAEVSFISSLIFTLINTLQVEKIFKISLFSLENITGFFNLVFIISALYIALTVIKEFFRAMLSHIMLFTDEVVYVDNFLFTRKVIRVPIHRISHTTIKQSWIERILDIGVLLVETSDNKEAIQIRGVTSITDKNKKIMDKVKSALQKTS